MDLRDKPESYGVTLEDFIKWRSPQSGKTNPKKITSNVWEWLFRTKLSGYWATQFLHGPSSFEEGPTLSFARYGQSVTHLPDGRIFYIAGEHEDHYDPDFYIYNDVVVEYPDGKLEFYCYPKSKFIATDFHSATLLGENIILIGNLGYSNQRMANQTPVYSLNTKNLKIKEIICTGETPGWISSHKAVLKQDQQTIQISGGASYIDNASEFKSNNYVWGLNTKTWSWQRLPENKKLTWRIVKEGGGYISFFQMRSELSEYKSKTKNYYRGSIERFEKYMGFKLDIDLLKNLYNFYNVKAVVDVSTENYWTSVDGAILCFIENYDYLEVTIEGELSPEKLALIKEQLLAKLSQLTRLKWTLTES